MSLYGILHLICAAGAIAVTAKPSNGPIINVVVALVCLLLGPMALAACLFGLIASLNDRPVVKDGARK